MEQLPNEGVLFNQDSRLEYKISKQKNSKYDKPQRRFEINVSRLIKTVKLQDGTTKKTYGSSDKVMHLPEENLMQFLKDMGYLNK